MPPSVGHNQVSDAFDSYARHVSPSWVTLVKFMGFEAAEERAEGVLVYDTEGREYVDCLGGPGVFIAGHRHPKIIAAVKEQLDLMPLSSRLLLNRWQARAAERLAQVTPGDLQYTFLCNSGAEAVEGSLKLARMHTGRPKFVSTIGGFHGKTFGALSASGRETYRQPFQPLLPEFTHVPFGDADALAQAVDEQTAALILEPIQSEGGIVIPPKGYLARARQICDQSGALLILDEIQTGLGRTGRMFACDHESVVPDIMALGKALGGGVMPVGAFTSTPEVWECFRENPLIHSSTFGGNPLACRAALATLDVIEEQNLPALAAERGAQLLAGLSARAQPHGKLVADVRGRGLLIGVEFNDPDVGGLVIAGLASRRVLVAYTLNQPRVLRFEPPAIITPEQLDRVCEAFGQSLQEAADMVEGLA
ncbi:MAG: aspartate aminotransferase family protein [Armatimonadota bacterium]